MSLSSPNNSIKHLSFIYTLLNIRMVLFQTIQFSISTQFNIKTVPFQTTQSSISTQFCSIWHIDRTLSDATTPGQCRSESDGNERVLRIPQSSSFTGTSPLDCLVSYPGNWFGKSYPSADVQSVYSTAPADWAIVFCWFWFWFGFFLLSAWKKSCILSILVCKSNL